MGCVNSTDAPPDKRRRTRKPSRKARRSNLKCPKPARTRREDAAPSVPVPPTQWHSSVANPLQLSCRDKSQSVCSKPSTVTDTHGPDADGSRRSSLQTPSTHAPSTVRGVHGRGRRGSPDTSEAAMELSLPGTPSMPDHHRGESDAHRRSTAPKRVTSSLALPPGNLSGKASAKVATKPPRRLSTVADDRESKARKRARRLHGTFNELTETGTARLRAWIDGAVAHASGPTVRRASAADLALVLPGAFECVVAGRVPLQDPDRDGALLRSFDSSRRQSSYATYGGAADTGALANFRAVSGPEAQERLTADSLNVSDHSLVFRSSELCLDDGVTQDPGGDTALPDDSHGPSIPAGVPNGEGHRRLSFAKRARVSRNNAASQDDHSVQSLMDLANGTLSTSMNQ